MTHIQLKRMLIDCDLSQRTFAASFTSAPLTLGRALSGRLPAKAWQYRRRVEAAVAADDALRAWLAARGLEVGAIWDEIAPVSASERPGGMAGRMAAAHRRLWHEPALVPGDPLTYQPHKEADMIATSTLQFFGLPVFKSPFLNEIRDSRDIYLSPDHRFLKEMMLDTARFGGFCAVYGEVGSGKSVMRKAVVHELLSEDITVIFPVIVDKSRITPSSLIDAVIFDVSEEPPKRTLEAKTRQAHRLLRNRAASGMKQVLIVEEAHMLNVWAMKALKQIYELEDGYRRLIGIVLIGQTELRHKLDEARHPEMREVARRVTCAEIAGMDGDLEHYLSHKFARIGKRSEDVFDPEAFAAMSSRLTVKDGAGRAISKAYPLTVNNIAARAMNLAAEMGESRVTADVVMAL